MSPLTLTSHLDRDPRLGGEAGTPNAQRKRQATVGIYHRAKAFADSDVSVPDVSIRVNGCRIEVLQDRSAVLSLGQDWYRGLSLMNGLLKSGFGSKSGALHLLTPTRHPTMGGSTLAPHLNSRSPLHSCFSYARRDGTGR